MDGTDLSMAYASMYEPEPTFARPAPPPQIPVLDVPKATAPHAQPPEVAYTPPNAMYAQQSPRAEPQAPALVAEPSFMDRLANKKADVMKLVALALVVLLGIASDRMISHYLSGYISKSFLTDMQELLVRLAYPVGVIIVLWILKTIA
jgi:hypothetical protein